MGTKKQDALPFRAGLPTIMDVRALRERYPDSMLKVGFIITHEEVAKTIQVDPKTQRFGTVTIAWRRQVEKDTGLVLYAPGNKTYVVANPQEVLILTKRKNGSAIRFVRRSIDLGGLVDRRKLSDDEKKQLNYTQRINGAMLATAQLRDKTKLPTLEDITKEKRHAAIRSNA